MDVECVWQGYRCWWIKKERKKRRKPGRGLLNIYPCPSVGILSGVVVAFAVRTWYFTRRSQ
ncbi:hypothetical protein BDV37DRAFT_239601 [Aspergillus pseudonomiae]|uniref:Transmembrane protein n=1 Tax=Aspergillus pseudonomiae TaxID=1506151 RepID=A0A5N7DNG3_9EURO|nr:uncharacterized protein BDV37DRAFT_239601 [Aspergillus pseudonomiae]KAE8407982.1 hypothetical protein BDV37DRAFT_239601 [Aspergillus pseudonomiae]